MRVLRWVLTTAVWVFLTALTLSAQSERPPQRVVSISPAITEILSGLGVFDRVVAVSDYCIYPAGVKNLPRVGSWLNTNVEKILSLRPDLILITDAQVPFIGESFQKLNLRYVAVPSLSLDDTFRAIDQVGQAVGRVAEASRLVKETRQALDGVHNKTRGVVKPRVLCVVDRTPGTLRDLTVVTPGSFLNELVQIAGGVMATMPTKGGYVTINKEALLAIDPDIILDIVHTPGGRLSEDLQSVWSELPSLRAVREHKVYPVRNEFILHTSQFVNETVRLLAETMHPEIFRGQRK
jgi:iron complex transport system substrate-binding protein